jgi:hypothetical protein
MRCRIPGDDYLINFQKGDPYIKVEEGYARLPGAGYAAMHPELEGVDPEDYPDIDKLRILGDVAPYSREYQKLHGSMAKMWLEVDGHRYQTGSTRTMVFGVAYLVRYLSRFMSLQPGDIISTGTPRGVGFGQKPPIYLRPGNTVTLGIKGLGQQRQRVIPYAGE